MRKHRNEKAIEILRNAYWSRGWRSSVKLSDEDRSYLEETGYLHSNPADDHEQCVKRALDVRSRISEREVADAFLYSLSTRALEYRSALGSLAVIRHLPDHQLGRTPKLFTYFCDVCGFSAAVNKNTDFGALNFERHMWGGIRHDQLPYAAYDLERFEELEPVEPGEEDGLILRQILELAERSKNITALRKAMTKVVKSNNAERDNICQLLSYAGVLLPDDCRGYFHSYTPYAERNQGHVRSDQNYPLTCWRPPGVQWDVAAHWFPSTFGD